MPQEHATPGRRATIAPGSRRVAVVKEVGDLSVAPLKILLTEGSSTSARQTLYALGRLGHTVDVCDPQRLCLARFSRFVRRLYRCPPFTADPSGYLDFLDERIRREGYDVLLPTHDQVYLLARFPERFCGRVGVALPPFQSIAQMQSKAQFTQLLDSLGLPQPRTAIVEGIANLKAACDSFPCYVKLAYSTAGRGVWRVEAREELPRIRAALESLDEQDRGQIVVQEAVPGVFHVAQAVFEHGQLLAAGSYRARAAGVGGSAHARESVSQPVVYEHLALIGRRLNWHGAMHIEYLCDPATDSPTYIEANPRIGETMNAVLGGANLCEILVEVSKAGGARTSCPLSLWERARVRARADSATTSGDDPSHDSPHPNPLPKGEGTSRATPAFSRPGVRTHSLLMALMAAAERGEGRRGVLAEIRRWRQREGVYHESQDELIRPREDPRALLPAVVVIAQLLASPTSVTRTVRRTVDNYALTAAAVRAIAALPSSASVPNAEPDRAR
jgi:hypothetical protein